MTNWGSNILAKNNCVLISCMVLKCQFSSDFHWWERAALSGHQWFHCLVIISAALVAPLGALPVISIQGMVIKIVSSLRWMIKHPLTACTVKVTKKLTLTSVGELWAARVYWKLSVTRCSKAGPRHKAGGDSCRTGQQEQGGRGASGRMCCGCWGQSSGRGHGLSQGPALAMAQRAGPSQLQLLPLLPCFPSIPLLWPGRMAPHAWSISLGLLPITLRGLAPALSPEEMQCAIFPWRVTHCSSNTSALSLS